MMLSEAFGLPSGHDRVPMEISSRFDTPEKADAYAADIIEWCRWAALPPAERGEAAREWWLRGQVNQAEAALDRFTASMKSRRTAGVADWLKGQRTVAKAVRAQWRELTRRERREHITEVRQGDGVSLNFGDRRNLVGNAMLRHWSGIPPKERTSYITAVVRGAWSALGADERTAMEAQWLKGLPAYAGNCLWLAWRWHHKTENDRAVLLSPPAAPVRPSLLVATAAALDLVAGWDDEGRPVPAEDIRGFLGLPKHKKLPAFLRAARLIADAARSGKTKTDAEWGKLVGVTSMTIGNWRPDFARFANSTDDHFFPLGLEGLPHAPAMSLDQIEAECAAIADAAQAEREARADDGNRRRRQMKAKPVKPRAALFRAAVVITRNGWAVPDAFVRAMAAMLDLASASNRRPLIAPDVLKGLGIPGNVKNMALFREAARRDGEVLRGDIHAMTMADGRTFAAAWADAKDDKVQSGELCAWFFAMVSRTLDDGWLTKGKATLTPAVLSLDIGMGENGRATIRDDWRPLPEYRRLVHEAATAFIMMETVWRGSNRKAV